jgi:integrase
MLHETGARPSELARLTAEDVDFGAGVAILTEHKTAHATGKARRIVLSPNALAIVTAQAEAHPEGPIPRNSMGDPWMKKNIGYAMRGTCRRAGVSAIVYGYRHTYATDALSKGVPDSVVAALLGHSTTTMLHKHYSHLTGRVQVLRDALGKVRG